MEAVSTGLRPYDLILPSLNEGSDQCKTTKHTWLMTHCSTRRRSSPIFRYRGPSFGACVVAATSPSRCSSAGAFPVGDCRNCSHGCAGRNSRERRRLPKEAWPRGTPASPAPSALARSGAPISRRRRASRSVDLAARQCASRDQWKAISRLQSNSPMAAPILRFQGEGWHTYASRSWIS